MKLHNILAINGIDIEDYLNDGEYYKSLNTSLYYIITCEYSNTNYLLKNNIVKGNFNLISNWIYYENLNIEDNNLKSNTFHISNTTNSIFNLNITANDFSVQLMNNDFVKITFFNNELSLTYNNKFKLNCDNFIYKYWKTFI